MDRKPEEDEPYRDPRALKAIASFTETEILSHHNVYVGVDLAEDEDVIKRHVHNGRGVGHSHAHGKHLSKSEEKQNAAPRVQFFLDDPDHDNGQQPHPLFSEMAELVVNKDGEQEWKETARWVKFEEDVEEGGNRWSKPYVATLSLHSLFELRSMLLNGTVCLDVHANSLDEICDSFLDTMINTNQLTYEKKAIIKEAVLRKHRHQYESNKQRSNESNTNSTKTSNMSTMARLPIIRSLADIGKNHSSAKTLPSNMEKLGGTTTTSLEVPATNDVTVSPSKLKPNYNFMRKVPKDAEASNILIGELAEIDRSFLAFIRLAESAHLGDLTEVPLPTRFLLILMGPQADDKINLLRYREIGRAMATVMSDEIFHEIPYKARTREQLLAGIDKFLSAVTVLPPGAWDPSIRIEPPAVLPSNKKNPQKVQDKFEEVFDEEEERARLRREAGLIVTGRPFGGLINDIRRKMPFYLSDFKDSFALQCLASMFFIYFACLTSFITFGGLLGDATENRIAAIETLMSGFVVGVLYGLFSGQPLSIMSLTGPILVFDTILYDFCKSWGWEYLPFRLCIGLWTGLFLFIILITDATAYISYITRFTEESFATLVALIFIKKAIEQIIKIGVDFPLHPSTCLCTPKNSTIAEIFGSTESFNTLNSSKPDEFLCEFTVNDTLVVSGLQTSGCHYHPNAFLMSLLLFIGTFLVSYNLRQFREQSLFSANVRGFVSDFAVIIAIASMTCLDMAFGVDTPKLNVPKEFHPTWSGRGWLIHPIGSNPWWLCIVAIVPALFATVLIFMDQQITAVIVNRKEHKLVKGCGYHLDLLILLIGVVICSIFGLPWFVAATVLSINHVKSLTRVSECAAPGEKPQFLGIREQRLTRTLAFVMIGISILLTPILCHVPLPVLYGVFLYMGVNVLKGIQFTDRLLLFFMPNKYQPDHAYLRRMPITRVHLFTSLQLGFLIILWIVKNTKETSILFPIMLVVMMGVRILLEFVFTQTELKILDDPLPFNRKKTATEKEEDIANTEELLEDEKLTKPRHSLRYTPTAIEVPMANGNIIKIPVASDIEIDISEEMNRCGVWKDLKENVK